MKLLLIVNSTASSVTGRRRVVIHKALSADHEVKLADTARRGHADRLARAAASEGVDVVVVLGGDGTLSEAANGLPGTDTALASLPGGSTNVFSRIIGVPDDPMDAAGWLLDALDRGAVSRIGLGVADGRYFLFHCGIGFDAAVVEQVERRGPWKRWAGHPLFMYTAMDAWLRRRNRRRPPLVVLDADGTALTEGRFVVILNANPYTFLGTRGIDLVPEATFDSSLATVTLSSLSLHKLLPAAGRALWPGGVGRMPGVVVHTEQNRLTVTADPPAPYQLDGDHLGYATRLELRWCPDALRLVTG